METKREKILLKALEIIKTEPKGIRYSELVGKIKEVFSDIPVNTIHGTVWNLDARMPQEVYKPLRGIFRHNNFRDAVVDTIPKKVVEETKKIREEDFYQPFADWLVNDLEECTKAIHLGGNKFKDKWGTPDVIGIREPKKSDIIKPPTEIISAEIKIDAGNLITAFGQSCAYKLFSHKSYIVIPKLSSEEDVVRLDALCRIFGVGLILFDNCNVKEPGFEIRVRATKHDPDMFYVNKSIRLIEDDLFS